MDTLMRAGTTQLDRGYRLPNQPAWAIRDNMGRAARYGLDAIVITDAAGEDRDAGP